VDPITRRLGELARLACKPALPGMAAAGGSESGMRKLPPERGVFEKLDAVLASMRMATPCNSRLTVRRPRFGVCWATRQIWAWRCFRPICNSDAAGPPSRARHWIWRSFSTRIWL